MSATFHPSIAGRGHRSGEGDRHHSVVVSRIVAALRRFKDDVSDVLAGEAHVGDAPAATKSQSLLSSLESIPGLNLAGGTTRLADSSTLMSVLRSAAFQDAETVAHLAVVLRGVDLDALHLRSTQRALHLLGQLIGRYCAENGALCPRVTVLDLQLAGAEIASMVLSDAPESLVRKELLRARWHQYVGQNVLQVMSDWALESEHNWDGLMDAATSGASGARSKVNAAISSRLAQGFEREFERELAQAGNKFGSKSTSDAPLGAKHVGAQVSDRVRSQVEFEPSSAQGSAQGFTGRQWQVPDHLAQNAVAMAKSLVWDMRPTAHVSRPRVGAP